MFDKGPFTTAQKRKKAKMVMRLIIALAVVGAIFLVIGTVVFLGRPACEIVSWPVGKEATFTIENTTLYTTVDAIGPEGASMRGIPELLEAGDRIVRQTPSGRWLAFGEIRAIYNTSVDVCLYDRAVEVTPSPWGDQLENLP